MSLADDLVEVIEENYDVEEIEKLLNEGADPNEPNEEGSYPLTAAVNAGNDNVVKLLLQRGADVNVEDPNFGGTALFIDGDVSNDDDNDIFRLLIDAGADLSLLYEYRQIDQITVLMLACINGHVNRVKILLEAGADVNQKSGKGDTALLIAARAGKRDIVNVLLQNGADRTIVNNVGESAEHLLANELLAAPHIDYTKFQKLKTLKGHTDTVYTVAFSPDGSKIVSGSDDNTIKIWDAMNGQEIKTLEGHIDEIHSVAFSPNGSQIVSGSEDKTIKIWDAMNGQEIKTLEGHTSTVESVAFSPNGLQIVSGSFDKTIKIWNAMTGQIIKTLIGHTHLVHTVAFSPDGSRIVSGSSDETVKIWDVMTGQEIKTLKGHNRSVFSVAFSPDGSKIVSASYKTIKIWDVMTGQELKTLKGHIDFSVAFSPNGSQIVSGSDDKTIIIWGEPSVAVVESANLEDTLESDDLFNPNYQPQQNSAYEEPEGEVVIHDWVPKIKLRGEQNLTSVAFSSNGTKIAFAGIESDINVINLENMRSLTIDRKHVTYSRDGNWIGIVSEFRGAKLKSTYGRFERQLFDENSDNKYTCIDFSPDSKHVVTGSRGLRVCLWDVETGSLLRTLNGHEQDESIIISVKFSPDNQHFASLADNIMVWSVTGGLVNMMRKNDEDEINGMTYNPDGKSIVFVTTSDVHIWNLKTNNVEVLNSDHRRIESVAFSPDGKYIMTGDDVEATIQLWDAKTRTKLALFKSFLEMVNSIAFSPDGKMFLLGGGTYRENNRNDQINLVLGELSELLKLVPVTFPKEIEKITLKRANVTLSEEPDIFDTFMAETYPLNEYIRENPNSIVFLIDKKNGFGYDRDQLREMTIGAQDYYFKCLKLNEALVVALSKVEGETPFLLLRSAGTFYVPAAQLQAALDSKDSIFILREYDTLPYTASIAVIETAPLQRNHRGEQINVVSRDHCQAGSNKKAYEIIAVANANANA